MVARDAKRLGVDARSLPMEFVHLLNAASCRYRDYYLLPAPATHSRLSFGRQFFGCVHRIKFKGHSVNARVCDIDDAAGYKEALLGGCRTRHSAF